MLSAVLLCAALLGGIVVFSASTAANTVPSSRLGVSSPSTINANALKPTACAALTLTALVTGSGTINGANGSVNELILGSSGNDTINAKAGSDCIVGGGGIDNINGGGGGDVCIGTAGSTFTNCATIVNSP